jgi:hypothetical protein
MSEIPKPTPRQLATLRKLALMRGMTFAWPETRAQASRQIALLVGRASSPGHERRADRDAVALRGSPHLPASSVREEEISGYGSSARWR